MLSIDKMLLGCQELNIDLTETQIEQFKRFKELLKEWNEKINLTAIKEDDEIDIKHFLDSLTLLQTKYFNGHQKVIDIGTGGGFPGVPLKIMKPELEITLFDSLKKRLNYLDIVIEELELSQIETLHGRAEDFAKEVKREKYDRVVSRAVANLSTLSEYCLPYVKVGGYFIAMKGPIVEEEIDTAKKAIRILGGKIVEKIDVGIPCSDLRHNLVIIKKIKPTPKKYPRQAGKPKRNPL